MGLPEAMTASAITFHFSLTPSVKLAVAPGPGGDGDFVLSDRFRVLFVVPTDEGERAAKPRGWRPYPNL